MKKMRIMLFVLVVALVTGAAAVGAKKKMPDVIEGWFVGHRNAKVMLKEASGKQWEVKIDRNAKFVIDGRPVKLSDFRKGVEIYAELKNGILQYLSSYSTDYPGMEQPERAVRTGLIKYIDRDRLTLRLPTDDVVDYTLHPGTVIQKHYSKARVEELVEGDKVRIFLENEDSSVIQRMEVASSGVHVKYLVRGTLAHFDKYENILVLKDEEVFVNGNWSAYPDPTGKKKSNSTEGKGTDKASENNKDEGKENASDEKKEEVKPEPYDIPIGKDGLRVYYNEEKPVTLVGQKIPVKDLNYYKGRTMYLVVADDFGRPSAERIILKSQYESAYQTKITDIQPYQNLIELENKRNVAWADGTVYIRRDRILDIEDMEEGLDALVISDGRNGGLTASLIYVYKTDLAHNNAGRELLYMGRLQTVLPESVTLRDFFFLNQNQWESFGGEKEFFFDDDIMIFDAERGQEVGFREFVSREYSIDESVSRKKELLRDWYAYLWADGDRVSAAYMKKSNDSLLRQRITEGIVLEAPKENKLTGLFTVVQNAKDYSTHGNRWLLKHENLNLYLKDAFVIKDGQRISAKEIRKGDRVYVVRDANQAVFVLVKTK